MQVTRNELRARLYEHGLDIEDKAASPKEEKKKGAFSPGVRRTATGRGERKAAGGGDAQATTMQGFRTEGTVDINQARRLITTMKNKATADPPMPAKSRASATLALVETPRKTLGTRLPEINTMLRGRESLMGPLEPQEPQTGEHDGRTTKQQRDPFEVFIELLRGATKKEETEGLEFVYVRHLAGAGPYDVELIPFHAVDPQCYLTVSPHGFTEYYNGLPCDFVKLERWLDERQLYKSVRELRFFQEFAKRKSFHLWRDAWSHERMSKASAVLEERLFMLHPEFRALLLSIRSHCLELADARVVTVSFPQPKNIHDFAQAQRCWRRDVFTKAGHLAMRMHDEVCATFAYILDRVRKESRGPVAALSTLGTTSFGRTGSSRMGINRIGANTGTAMIQGPRHGMQAKADGEALEALGFPKDIGYGQRSALKKECGRFVRFGCLVDLLTAEALLELSRNSLADVVVAISPLMQIQPRCKSERSLEKLSNRGAKNEVSSGDPRLRGSVFDMTQTLTLQTLSPDRIADTVNTKAAPLFKVEADIAGGVDHRDEINDVELWPDKDSLTHGLLDAVEEGCKIMEVFQRLATHVDLEPYRNVLDPLDAENQPKRRHNADGEPTEGRQPQTLMAFMDHLVLQDNWLDSMRDLGSAIEFAFAEAVDELKFFARHIERCRECLRTDIAMKVNSALEAGSVQGLGALLDEYESEVSELHSLPPSLILHVLDVDISTVKSQLLKGPTKCRKHLHVLLPEMAAQRSGNLGQWIITCKQQLAVQPDGIAKFVQQVGSIETIGLEAHARAQQLARVRELCDLIDLHKIEMAGPDRKQAVKVARDFSDFRQWIAGKEFEVSKQKDRFVKELELLEANVETEISQLKERVCSEDFLVLVTEMGSYGPGCIAPSQALVSVGKVPTLLAGDQPRKDELAEADVEEKVQKLRILQTMYEELCGTTRRYNSYQEMLGQDQTPWPALDVVQSELLHRISLWEALQSWKRQFAIWVTTTLPVMVTQEVTQEVATIWAKVREAQGGLPSNPVFEELRTHIMLVKDSIPAIAALQNPHIKERHCKAVSEHLDITGFTNLLVGTLLEFDVARRRNEIQNISSRATQEHIIEMQLQSLELTWAGIEFSVVQYRPEQRDSFVLGSIDQVSEQLDDSLVTVNAMLTSSAVQPHIESARGWQFKLGTTQQTLQEWVLCQHKWKYLERIFVVPDIQKQLIRESNTFQTVDSSWRQIMLDTQLNPAVIPACLAPGLRENLQEHHRTLDTVELELNDYLETKRMAFPRFYFLSNDELLTVTAHGREPKMIDFHIGKCFGGVNRLDFGEDRNLDVHGVISEEGERVGLGRLKIRTHIEETLDVIQVSMLHILRLSLHSALRNALDNFAAGPFHQLDCGIADWAFEPHPAQATHTAAQITFCRAVEEMFAAAASGQNYIAPTLQVQEWHKTTRLASLSLLVQQELTTLQRRAILGLLTSEVHNRDVLNSLATSSIPGQPATESFEWQKQLRYYWEHDEHVDLADQSDICIVRQLDARYAYAFEYEGVASRLVVTPLTERCWLVITQASQIRKGTALSGSAGTGKTETVKDLAKALAVLCVEFNCSDQLSPKLSGQLIAGLAQQGCWACLDEFNCVEVEVLSVVAQQLSKVQQALRMDRESLEFEGAIMPLKHSINVCVTMNPCGESSGLPESLLIGLRPVAMAIPISSGIIEVVLLAEGFTDAPALAERVSTFCRFASDLLAEQRHYDFGLRTVKSVLARAGDLRRKSVHVESAEPLTPNQEGSIIVEALTEAHGPRLIASHVAVFTELLKDIFPGYRDPGSPAQHFVQEIIAACRHLRVKPLDRLQTKACEVYVAQQARMGVLLIGPAGGGKSTILNVVAEALAPQSKQSASEARRKAEVNRLNPKTLSFIELFGSVNTLTGEWVHGLVSRLLQPTLAHKAMEESLPLQWVIFDGPIDPVWIESLNAVLDDNRTLCLADSERIRVPDELRIFFESDEVGNASPAIVSRCATVYHPEMDMSGLEVCLQNHLHNLRVSWLPKPSLEAMISTASSLALRALCDLARVRSGEHTSMTDLQLIHCFGLLFAAVITPKPFSDPVVTPHVLYGGHPDGMAMYSELFPPPLSEAVPTSLDHDVYVSSCLAFALAWTFGSTSTPQQRTQVNSWCKTNVPELVLPQGLELYNVMVDWRSSAGYFTPWDRVCPPAPLLSQEAFSQVIIPTSEIVSHNWVTFMRARSLGHTLLFGAPGSGKTVIGTHMVRQSQQVQAWSPIDILFSAWTSAEQVQKVFEKRLQQKKGAKLGAPAGMKVLVFIDDVNAPLLDASGARPPLELLRQVLDSRGGFYDRKSWVWQEVQDSTFLATAGTPALEAPWMTPRLARHFTPLRLPDPTRHTLSSIFGPLLLQIVGSQEQHSEISRMGPTVCKATIDMFCLSADTFRPAPSTPFYAFNLRDAWRVVQGLAAIRGNGAAISSGSDLTKLWAHEAIRVFQDRMAPGANRKECGNLVDGLLQSQFKTQWRPSKEGGPFRYVPADFIRPSVDGSRSYGQLQDETKLQTVLQELMKEYNKEFGGTNPLRLVFFSEAISHLCRLVRSCKLHRSHALVVGLTGSGRRSLCALAAFIADVRRYTVSASNAIEFREFLKGVVRNCGVRGQVGIVILTDEDIVDEVLLEDIVALINLGYIPNIWGAEETESIRKETKSIYDAHHVVDGRQPGSEGRVVSDKHIMREDDPDGPWRLFLNHIRDLFHTMLCMTPAGESLRLRCRRFPALTTCCYVDYVEPWPEEALYAVASAYLEEVPGVAAQKGAAASLATAAVRAHAAALGSAEHCSRDGSCVHIMPMCHLDMVSLYVDLSTRKRGELERARGRLLAGLEKLRSSTAHVLELEQELTALRPNMDEKSQKTKQLSEKVTNHRALAESISTEVTKERDAVENKKNEIFTVESEAKAELEAAMPEYRTALAAIEKLDKKDLQEIKSFQNPPPLVLMVMQCISMLLGHSTDWVTIKNVLSEPAFLRRLKDLSESIIAERYSLPDKTASKLKSYSRREEFDPREVEKQSHSARSLCMWCRSLSSYIDIAKEVEPKRAKARSLLAELQEAQTRLQAKQVEHDEVLTKVDALQNSQKRTVDELQELIDNKNLTERRLGCARELTGALKEEETRWMKQSKEYSEDLDCMFGDVFLAASSIAYAGPFNQKERAGLVGRWLSTCKDSFVLRSCKLPWTLQRVMLQPTTLQEWRGQGLPTDEVSVDSATIVKSAMRWPFCIDPQGQFYTWICRHAEGTGVKEVEATSPSLPQKLEECNQAGAPIIITDCSEQLPKILDSWLNLPNERRLGPGGGLQDASQGEGFALYLATSLRNPQLSPQVFVSTSVVNFAVSFAGLCERLLSEVVQLESPDLEKKRVELVSNMFEDQQELDCLSDKILSLLSESEGNILDQSDLIDTLSGSKDAASSIARKVADRRAMEQRLEQKRVAFRPVAERGAVLYFAAASMESVCQMYACSLSRVMQIFIRAIQAQHGMHQLRATSTLSMGSSRPTTEDSEGYKSPLAIETPRCRSAESDGSMGGEGRSAAYIDELVQAVTHHLLTNLLSGFFERHRIVAALHFCIELGRLRGEISERQCLLLMKGSEALDDPTCETSSGFVPSIDTPDRLCFPAKVWKSVRALAMLEPATFQQLPYDIAQNLDVWRIALAARDATLAAAMNLPPPLLEGQMPESSDEAVGSESLCAAFPGRWGTNELSRFNQVLLIRALQPLQLLDGLRKFMMLTLGKSCLAMQPTLREVYEASECKRPIIIVLAQGVDPAAELTEVAEIVLGSSRHLRMVSLGKGQEEKACQVIDDSIQQGHWVLLQNCHLARNWLPSLDRYILRAFSEREPNERFRLFLANSMVSPMPISLLQRCTKITCEPARSVRASFLRTVNEDFDRGGLWERLSEQKDGRRILVALALFHAVVQERHKFGPLCFNHIYAFTESDRHAAQNTLVLLLESGRAHWYMEKFIGDVLSCIIADGHYGGRVTDEFDRRCISAIFTFLVPLPGSQKSIKFATEDACHLDAILKDTPSSLQELRMIGDSMPLQDDPELFGMHANADIALRERQAQEVLALLEAAQVAMPPSGEAEATNIASQIAPPLPARGNATFSRASLAIAASLGRPCIAAGDGYRSGIGLSRLVAELLTEIPHAGGRDRHEDSKTTTGAPYPGELGSCLATFLMRESSRFDALLQVIRSNLQAVSEALAGRTRMSDRLEASSRALRNRQLPEAWQAVSYPSCRPLGSWVANLSQRVDNLREWEKHKELPPCFHMSHFFAPQCFVTSILQAFSRSTGVPLENAKMSHTVKSSLSRPEDVRSVPSRGVFVHGIYIEGARWDVHGQQLEECRPGALCSSMPVIHFAPIDAVLFKSIETKRTLGSISVRRTLSKRSAQHDAEQVMCPTPTARRGSQMSSKFETKLENYECPLYRTSARAGNPLSCGKPTNHICSVSLPTAAEPVRWILRGVSLVCEPDE